MQITNHFSINTFGWNPKTHGFLTRTALRNFPELKKSEKIISLGSIAPDFTISHCGIGNKSHEYFGELVDATVPQDALGMYFENIGKAIYYLQFGPKNLGLFRAANALHFLQDVALPLHTQKKASGKLHFLSHLKFEKDAIKRHVALKTAIRDGKPTNEDYYKLFEDTYQIASNMKNPYLFKKDRANIMKDSLKLAYDSTNSFLQFIQNLKKY